MRATADSSVVVAALASWHENHTAARAYVKKTDFVIAHVLAETFAVLTGFPPPNRVPVSAAAAALTDLTRERDVVEIDSSTYVDLIAIAEDEGIVGGAIYDALIGATARRHNAALFSLDRRARSMYEVLNIEVEFVGQSER
jgi:predicted nucleic acid-binding protein